MKEEQKGRTYRKHFDVLNKVQNRVLNSAQMLKGLMVLRSLPNLSVSEWSFLIRSAEHVSWDRLYRECLGICLGVFSWPGQTPEVLRTSLLVQKMRH